MNDIEKVPTIDAAIEKIRNFVEGVAAFRPETHEITRALGQYFVLKEIKDHIVMMRTENYQETKGEE